MAERGAAVRLRERQLRAWHRHVKMTEAMELATAFHHSAVIMVCEGSTGKRSPQGMENGLRAPQHPVEGKKRGTKAWRQRIRSSEPDLRPWKRRKVKESKEGKGGPSGRESGLEEVGCGGGTC